MGRLQVEFGDTGGFLLADKLDECGYFLVSEFNGSLPIGIDSTGVGDTKTLFAFNSILCPID